MDFNLEWEDLFNFKPGTCFDGENGASTYLDNDGCVYFTNISDFNTDQKFRKANRVKEV
jgi:hypothetical protein